MLFKPKTIAKSEEYQFPNVTDVKVTIEGVPNSVYSQGMNMSYFFNEAERVFLNRKRYTLLVEDFFSGKKFSLVVDLRAFNDNNVAWSSRKIQNTQSGVLLKITKEANKSGVDLYCYIFVVSDGMVNITNKALQNVQF